MKEKWLVLIETIEEGWKRRRLTVPVGECDRASVALLVDGDRVIAALPDVIITRSLLERHAEIRDLVLVPQSDFTGITRDLTDENPNAGLSRGGERNAH